MMDFVSIVVAAGFLLAIVDLFLPQEITTKLICLMFDTTGKLTNNGARNCVLASNGIAGLGGDLLLHRNDKYAENLYKALTGEYGFRFILAIFGSYFIGKKIFFNTRQAVRSLLGASVGTDIGGNMFGSAVMEAQETTRRSVGFGLSMIPGVGKISESLMKHTSNLTDSVTSAGTRTYNAVSNLAAQGIGASATAVNATGRVTSGIANGIGNGSIALGKSLTVGSFGLLAPIGLAFIVLGGAFKAVGLGVRVASQAVALVLRAIQQIVKVIVKASQVLVKGAAGAGNKIAKGAGRAVSNSVKQFFYLPGNTADIKAAEERAKAKKKKIWEHYYKH